MTKLAYFGIAAFGISATLGSGIYELLMNTFMAGVQAPMAELLNSVATTMASFTL